MLTSLLNKPHHLGDVMFLALNHVHRCFLSQSIISFNASSYTSSKGCLSNTTALPLWLAAANARTSCSGQIKSFLCPILNIGTEVRVPSNPCVLSENTWHLVRSNSH